MRLSSLICPLLPREKVVPSLWTMKTSPTASLTEPIASPRAPAVVDCANCTSPGSCPDDKPLCPSAGLPASTIVRPDYRFLGEGQRSNRRPIPLSPAIESRGSIAGHCSCLEGRPPPTPASTRFESLLTSFLACSVP